MSNQQLLGQEIRRLREERGYGEHSKLGGKVMFCEMARVSRPELDLIEQGKISPRVETLEKIAGALGMKVRDLIPF